jgi:hypothetical protein
VPDILRPLRQLDCVQRATPRHPARRDRRWRDPSGPGVTAARGEYRRRRAGRHPRRAGHRRAAVRKSTLVRVQARGRSAEWRNLDSLVTRQSAASDPTGFVDFGELMVIDEIQRVPELLLAIKGQVDTDPRPGRYLRPVPHGCSGFGRSAIPFPAAPRRSSCSRSRRGRSTASRTASSMPCSRALNPRLRGKILHDARPLYAA